MPVSLSSDQDFVIRHLQPIVNQMPPDVFARHWDNAVEKSAFAQCPQGTGYLFLDRLAADLLNEIPIEPFRREVLERRTGEVLSQDYIRSRKTVSQITADFLLTGGRCGETIAAAVIRPYLRKNAALVKVFSEFGEKTFEAAFETVAAARNPEASLFESAVVSGLSNVPPEKQTDAKAFLADVLKNRFGEEEAAGIMAAAEKRLKPEDVSSERSQKRDVSASQPRLF